MGIEPTSLAWKAKVIPIYDTRNSYSHVFLVEGEGFEPSKAEPTDLQSVPFGHSGTSPEFWEKRDFQKPVKHPTLSSNAGRQNPFKTN